MRSAFTKRTMAASRGRNSQANVVLPAPLGPAITTQRGGLAGGLGIRVVDATDDSALGRPRQGAWLRSCLRADQRPASASKKRLHPPRQFPAHIENENRSHWRRSASLVRARHDTYAACVIRRRKQFCVLLPRGSAGDRSRWLRLPSPDDLRQVLVLGRSLRLHDLGTRLPLLLGCARETRGSTELQPEPRRYRRPRETICGG